MFELQTKLIFPTHAVAPPGRCRPARSVCRCARPTATTCAASTSRRTSRATATHLILGFGGNAWNGQDVAEYLHKLFPDDEVVAFHYRGYAPSTGSPSAEALIADAPLVYDLRSTS